MGAPVGHTCPDIDSVKSNVQEAIKGLTDLRDNIMDRSISKIEDTIIDCLHHLSGMDNELEDLRTSNSELRDWGTNLEDAKTELENKFDELERERDDLQETLDNCVNNG